MKKLLFIYNPCAGKGMIRNKLSDIVERFCIAGYEVTIYATQGKNDATKIAAERGSEYDLVVCSGGDGTLNEVTIGLMNCTKRPPCGYIPAGTTNDMASSLGLYKNMTKAAETVVDGELFPYDLGTLNDDYFIYVAGFGAFTDVSYATSQNIKNILGRLAYLLEGVKRVPSLQSFRYQVEYDGKVIKDDFIFGMVTNSNSIGGFRGLNGKDVSLNDGLFEVLLIKEPHNLIDMQMIINSLISGNLNPKFCISFHTSKLKMISDEMIPWTIDGEFGGNFREVEIINHPSAISYITKKTK